jgi:outer membrane protein assembly factor BamB
MFGFNQQHTHYNPSETVLNPGNVSKLVRYWSMTASSSIYSSPVVDHWKVYIGSTDHKLYAFNAGTGITLWIFRTGGKIISSPTVVNGVVYFGSYDGKLYALHLPGTS